MTSLTTNNTDKDDKNNKVSDDTSSVTPFNVKRLLKDVKHIYKEPLTEHGIYYHHDDDNYKKGYALIIGPSDTLYRHGMYFFELKFPDDYPFSPPKVVFLTQGNNVRFNPNLYRNGKVCLSILNTWRGEQWTSCQNINSILLTIAMHCFTNTPLLNEPGVSKTHTDYKVYNDIIEYSNYSVAIVKCINNKGFFKEELWNIFEPHVKKYIKDNKDSIINDFKEIITKKISKGKIKFEDDDDPNTEKGKTKWCGMYSMKIPFNYHSLLNRLDRDINKFLN
jgi:ubiquitin-protein ligase